jgi:hypothetical protein
VVACVEAEDELLLLFDVVDSAADADDDENTRKYRVPVP